MTDQEKIIKLTRELYQMRYERKLYERGEDCFRTRVGAEKLARVCDVCGMITTNAGAMAMHKKSHEYEN